MLLICNIMESSQIQQQLDQLGVKRPTMIDIIKAYGKKLEISLPDSIYDLKDYYNPETQMLVSITRRNLFEVSKDRYSFMWARHYGIEDPSNTSIYVVSIEDWNCSLKFMDDYLSCKDFKRLSDYNQILSTSIEERDEAFVRDIIREIQTDFFKDINHIVETMLIRFDVGFEQQNFFNYEYIIYEVNKYLEEKLGRGFNDFFSNK